jgi:hypothetical protein
MGSAWMPPLVVQKQGGGCRLRLANEAWGDGPTLQDAADDLVARVVRHATALRSGGFACPKDLSPLDPRWLDFLYEVGELAASGGDVRRRIVGLLE